MIKQAYTKPYEEDPKRKIRTMINLGKQLKEDKYQSEVQAVAESTFEASQLEKRNERSLTKTQSENAARKYMAKYEVAAMTETLTEFVTDIFYESLLLDDWAKEKYRASFHESVKTELLEIGGGDIYNTYKVIRKKTPLLENLCRICEETAVKQIDDKRKEVKEKGVDVDERVDFIINDENRSSFDKGKKEISSEDIEEIVKDKVVTTLAEEKERADKAQSDAAYIQAQMEELSGEQPTTESTFVKGKLETPTPYMALMVRASKMAMKENTEVDLDLVTAQAICEYTLLEVLHTMRIKEYSQFQLQEMARDYYYSK